MRTGIRRLAFSAALVGPVFAIWACGDDASSPQPNTLDAAVTVPTSTSPTPSPTTTADSTAPDGSGPDASTPGGLSCKAIHAANPALPSGSYTIDLDGTGPLPPLQAYCDMTFDGGGWTMLASFPQWANGPVDLTSPRPDSGVVDGGPDASWFVQSPAPHVLGAWSTEVAEALAALSTQIHIRTPFDVDAGVDGGAWVTSITADDGGARAPVQNIVTGHLLNATGDGGSGDWTGTMVANLTYAPTVGSGCALTTTPYPSLYWACSNFSGLHILNGNGTYQSWTFASPKIGTPKDPFEVYLR